LKEQKKAEPKPHSMTGFGRATRSSAKIAVQVELRSLNNKYLDLRVKMPRALSQWEQKARARINAQLQRGTIDLSVSFQILDPGLIRPIHEPTLRAYRIEVERLAGELGINSGLDLTSLLRLPGAVAMDEGLSLRDEKDQAAAHALLEEALDIAISDLVAMREQEGQGIALALRREASALSQIVAEVKSLGGEIAKRLLEAKRKQLAEILAAHSGVIDEARILQEAALLMARAEITEEIDRLASHTAQFLAALSADGRQSLGKRLEFIVQEMLREVNTIGSKADDLRVTRLVIDAKLTIDRLREQVQNLE
jgi:uncharacterized protein (TIGR00255 family)